METNQNNSNAYRHTHNGVDSPLLEGSSIVTALNGPQPALTPATSGLSSGGAAVLSNADAAILNNMRTRINELETKLQALGLIS